jgi:tetratricopeptide (TPR) repeat protein
VYNNQGKYQEAEQLSLRSLAIREKALGRDHPDVAQSLNNLASLYSNQGKFKEAEPLYKRALAIVDKTLGAEHPEIVMILKNYSILLQKTDRKAEAIGLAARADKIKSQHERENTLLKPSGSP